MQHAHESIEQGHAQARIVLHRALLFFQQAVKALSENRTIAGKNVIGRVSVFLSLLYSDQDYTICLPRLCCVDALLPAM